MEIGENYRAAGPDKIKWDLPIKNNWEKRQMERTDDASTQRIDQFFAMHLARADRWRDLAHAAREWAEDRRQCPTAFTWTGPTV